MNVSFVIPAYNAASTIQAAVASALDQTYPALEVIVVDDASTDGTLSVLEKMGDPRLKVLRLAENRGPSVARNLAMGTATGDLIACLDADDVATPNRLALQVRAFTSDRRTVLVTGAALSRPEGGGRACLSRSLASPGSLAWALRFRNPIVTSTATFRRAEALQAGGFIPALAVAEDHAMWLALAGCGRIVPLPELLAERTVHSGGLSGTRAAEMELNSIQACAQAIAELSGQRPSTKAMQVLRCDAAADHVPRSAFDEAVVTWCAVFDAVQGEMVLASHRRAAARESLTELRRLIRAFPGRRFELLRRVVRSRGACWARIVPSMAFLKLMRTMVEGR